MKRIITILILAFMPFCTPNDKSPTKQDWLIALTAVSYNFTDDCVKDYQNLSSIFPTYQTSVLSSLPTHCETAIIGDSTMDIGRQVSGFYDPSKTNNYGIGGNTACDMLYQMDFINCNPANVLIATADGNGILRNVAPSTSIKTIGKIISKAKEKWSPKIILIGVHPIQVTSANKIKNEVNEGVKSLADCYIDPLPIFGVGANDLPPSNFMADSIHYKEPIYTRYHNQILNQCGVSL